MAASLLKRWSRRLLLAKISDIPVRVDQQQRAAVGNKEWFGEFRRISLQLNFILIKL